MSESHAVATPAADRRSVLIAGLVIVVGVIATTLPQDVILAYIPLQNVLKNALHADRSANAAFFFWTTMPWNLKPLVGLCEDAVPIFGSRRKSYLMIGGALAALGWFALSLMPIRYAPLLTICIVISSAMVIASTAIGGYMVEAAKASASSGRLTSLRNLSQQFSVLVAGPAGGGAPRNARYRLDRNFVRQYCVLDCAGGAVVPARAALSVGARTDRARGACAVPFHRPCPNHVGCRGDRHGVLHCAWGFYRPVLHPAE